MIVKGLFCHDSSVSLQPCLGSGAFSSATFYPARCEIAPTQKTFGQRHDEFPSPLNNHGESLMSRLDDIASTLSSGI